MKKFVLPLMSVAIAGQPVFAQPAADAPIPRLSLAQQTSLRCSAAFALVSAQQERGEGTQYPDIGEDGREYFVRSLAQIMAQTGISRDQIARIMMEQSADLLEEGSLERVMPACLELLYASGL